VDPPWFDTLKTRTWPSGRLPMFTIEESRLLSALMRQSLFISPIRACAESLAPDNAARIASMQAAKQNIRNRLNEWSRDYNLSRQTAITQEVLEVAGGFEALEGA